MASHLGQIILTNLPTNYCTASKETQNLGQILVLKSELLNDTEFINVQFTGEYGQKRLSLDFAKLEQL